PFDGALLSFVILLLVLEFRGVISLLLLEFRGILSLSRLFQITVEECQPTWLNSKRVVAHHSPIRRRATVPGGRGSPLLLLFRWLAAPLNSRDRRSVPFGQLPPDLGCQRKDRAIGPTSQSALSSP